MKYNLKVILLISAVCALLVFNFGFLPGILRRAPEPAGIKAVTQQNALQTYSGGQSIRVQAPSIDDEAQNTAMPEPAAPSQQDDAQNETPPSSGSERTEQAPAPPPTPVSGGSRTEPAPPPATGITTEPPAQAEDVPTSEAPSDRNPDDAGIEAYIITEENAINIALEYYPGLDTGGESVTNEQRELPVNGQSLRYDVRESAQTSLYEVIFTDASIYGDAYWLVVFARDITGEKRLHIPDDMSATEFLRVNVKNDIDTGRYRKSTLERSDDGNSILVISYSYTERFWAEINALTGAVVDSFGIDRSAISQFSEIALPTNYISPPGYP